jgi:hypothetical protein
LGQVAAVSGEPQFSQNALSGSFSVPQVEHRIVARISGATLKR